MSILLKETEKEYLYSKLEYNKKKKINSRKDIIYIILMSKGDSNVSKDNFIKILNSLEYSIKKQMKNPDKNFRKEVARNVKSKIPNDWVGVKYSSIKAKKTRDNRNKSDEK